MSELNDLRLQVKRLLVENLMLQISADQIADDQRLFGPGSLGLDSVDALQLVVALDKNYRLKIPDSEAARQTLKSVDSIVAALKEHQRVRTS
jgi:acyl carrier protein